MTKAEYDKVIPNVTIVKFLGLNYLVTNKRDDLIQIDGHSYISKDELIINPTENPHDYFDKIDLKNKIISDLSLLDIANRRLIFSLLMTKSDSVVHDDLLSNLSLYKQHVYQAFRKRSFLEAAQKAYESLFDFFFKKNIQ